MRKTILVLCYHDPVKDPRIGWEVGELRKKYNVNVIGIADKSSNRNRNTNKNTLLEEPKNWKNEVLRFLKLIYVNNNAPLVKMINLFLLLCYATQLYKILFRMLPHYDKFNHTLYELSLSMSLIKQGLTYQHISIVHCNDIYTLLAGIVLKKTSDVPLVYDAHELYPYSIAQAPLYLTSYLKLLEHELIGHADIVFTVTPQIARTIKKWYDIKKVVVLPNAEKKTACKVRFLKENKILFLYQGGYFRDRGLEELIENWKKVDHRKAILYMRGPENEYKKVLYKLAYDLVEIGAIKFLKSVSEKDQVRKMKGADVGIIPYSPQYLNNRFSCPNKLSQYMQAGLAVLSSHLDYVLSIVKKYECGLIYDSSVDGFNKKVNQLIQKKRQLRKYKHNSMQAAHTYFNWERFSKIFIQEFNNL